MAEGTASCVRCRTLLAIAIPWFSCAAVLAGAGPAVAASQNWRTTVVLTSDYVQRGISQNTGDPALQGSLTYWHPTGVYGGAWASNIDTANRYYYGPAARSAHAEVDLFAGYTRALGTDWMLDLKTVGYLYPGDPAQISYNYLEVGAALSWRNQVHASFAFTPRTTWLGYTYGVGSHPAIAAELSLQQPVSQWLTWILGAGYRELLADAVPGYVYGSTSLALQIDRLNVELGYFLTDQRAERLFGPRLTGSRTVLTLSIAF